MTSKQNRIAFLFPYHAEMVHRILNGCAELCRFAPGIAFAQDRLSLEGIEHCRLWHADVVVAHLSSSEFTEPLAELNIPVVNTSRILDETPFYGVKLDNFASGVMAAEYALSKGYGQFVIFSQFSLAYARQRAEGFQSTVQKAGLPSPMEYEDTLPSPRMIMPKEWLGISKKLREWVETLPEDTLFFVDSDERGGALLEHLQAAGYQHALEIPLLSGHQGGSHSHAGITGVMQPEMEWGREAGRMAIALANGSPPPSRQLLLPPLGIKEMRSTLLGGIRDQYVADALRFIHQECARGINAESVADHCSGISRRSLEMRFAEILGKSVLQYIQETRVGRARHLLCETRLNLEEVSRLSGFTSIKHFNRVFHQYERLSPSDYRLRNYRF